MAATEQVTILLKAKDEASKVINGVSNNVNGLAKVAGTAMKVAGAAAVAAVGSITAAVGVGVKKAADMEQQVADIASVMGLTFDQAKPLKDLITQLGIDPKLKVSATEAADAIEMLARNGLNMTQILDGAARSTVLLANATNADFGTAANIATDVMAQFKISAEDMSTAVNGIVSVTTNSKFSIDDYGLALAQAGGIASSVGVDFSDFNTTIAAISPLFASGSDAGTSFKTFLQRLIPASNDAEAAMKALGLITEDGKNQFFDASGNMRSMGEIAGLLQTALTGLSEEQKNAALSTIFGTDAMRAAVGLAETGAEGFDKLAGSMAKVDAEATAATRMDTFSGALEILQGIIDGLLTQIGDKFLPILRNITEWAIAFADKHGPAVVAWFGNLAKWFADQQPVIQVWTERVFGALNEVILWLRGEKTDFTSLAAIWNGVATMIGNMVQRALQYIVENTPRWIAALMSWAQLAASWAVTLWDVHVWPGLQQFWSNMSTWLDANAGGLGTALGTWGNEFGVFVQNIVLGWQEAWPTIQRIVTDAANQIGTDTSRIIGNLNQIAGWFSGGEGAAAVSSWAGFFTTLANIVSATLVNLTGVIASVTEVVVRLGEMFAALQALDFGSASSIAADIAQRYIGLLAAPFTMPWQSSWDAWQNMQGNNGNASGQTSNTVNNTNTYNVTLQGSGNAGNDVLSSLRLVSSMYGN